MGKMYVCDADAGSGAELAWARVRGHDICAGADVSVFALDRG